MGVESVDVLGVRTNISTNIVSKGFNSHVGENSYWSTDINLGVVIAMDRSVSSAAQVWLLKGIEQSTQIDAGGSSIGADKGIMYEWKDNAFQFKGRSNDNVLTCFSIGFKW